MSDRPSLKTVEEQAALFVLGALPAEDAAPFQQRLNSGCPLCRDEVRAFEQAVSALPLTAPEVAPPPGLRASLMDGISSRKRPGHTVMGEGWLLRAKDTDWEPAQIPGVNLRPLHKGRTILVRMASQTMYPAHSHENTEQCLVLEGSISSSGVTAYAGDFIYMPAGSTHQPLYSESGCLLLIAYT